MSTPPSRRRAARPARRAPLLILVALAGVAAAGLLMFLTSPPGKLGGSALRGASTSPPAPSRYDKVLLVVLEDRDFTETTSSQHLPYLNQLATGYGLLTNQEAGYPLDCPGLPAYLLLTSGTDAGICDSRDPHGDGLAVPNLFEQVAQAGMQYRSYAQSMPKACSREADGVGQYLLRHAPVVYYASEKSRCAQWHLPLGDPGGGALASDLQTGLASFSLVVPDACHSMADESPCDAQGQPDDEAALTRGDAWLASWVPKILASEDYRSGRLLVVVTFDEGSDTDNRIATVVISPTTAGRQATGAYTHCSTLRSVQEILELPPLGCAAGASSWRGELGV